MPHTFRTPFPRNIFGWLLLTAVILCLSKINVQIFFFKNHLRAPLFEMTSIINYHHPSKCCFWLVLSCPYSLYLVPARSRWSQLVSASFSRFQLVPAVLVLRVGMSALMALFWNFRLVFFFVSRFSFYKNIWIHQSLAIFESFDNLLFRNKFFFIRIIWRNIAEEKKILYLFCEIKISCSYWDSHRRCSIKNMFLQISQSSQVFSCDFWEISENTYFTEHVWTNASCSYSVSCWCHL